MDIRSGGTWPASALSNFAPHPFEVRGELSASMEGFLQSLKFSSPDMARHVRSLVGRKAKFAGAKKNWTRTQTLFWQGEAFDRHGKFYQELLDEAFGAMFAQSDSARRALLATGTATLDHSLGKNKPNETVLTNREFISRLVRIRAQLQ